MIIHVVNPTVPKTSVPVLDGLSHILPAISGEFWDGVVLVVASQADVDSRHGVLPRL